jgi:hypothetical protein
MREVGVGICGRMESFEVLLIYEWNIYFPRANLPTRFHELNIHFGVWLGGLAGFNEIFLGNLPSFRGCMSHITYNSEDVILRAKTQPGEVSLPLKIFQNIKSGLTPI